MRPASSQDVATRKLENIAIKQLVLAGGIRDVSVTAIFALARFAGFRHIGPLARAGHAAYKQPAAGHICTGHLSVRVIEAQKLYETHATENWLLD
jgi:hypothetical protein